MKKTKVYNGYEEVYMTGREIKEHFNGCYECFGRHHEKVSSLQINFEKYFSKIKEDIIYRLFINDLFCRIMDGESDKVGIFLWLYKGKTSVGERLIKK